MRHVTEGYIGDRNFNGKAHGNGRYTFDNGDVYEGDWVDDIMVGKGKFISADGNVYEGDWVDDKMTGKGNFKFASGDSYEGDWLCGMRTGKGKFTYGNGNVYEGGFLNNASVGDGLFQWPNGNFFVGVFVADKMQQGQLFLASDDCHYAAVFSGGDEIVAGFRMYDVVLSSDGCEDRLARFSNGRLC